MTSSRPPPLFSTSGFFDPQKHSKSRSLLKDSTADTTPGAHEIHILADAFQSASAETVTQFMIYAAYISVAVIGFSMPILAFTPEGPFDKDGWFNFISEGFEKHSALATFIYGVGTLYIGFVRAIAIIIYIPNKGRATIYCLLIFITQGAGMLTTRNDQVKSLHLVAAAVWIGSSLAYHFFVAAFNRTYSTINRGGALAKWTWILSAGCALGFLIMVMTNAWEETRMNRLGTGIMEFVCAELILALDLIIISSIHIRFIMDL